jgi:hypothetical protein
MTAGIMRRRCGIITSVWTIDMGEIGITTMTMMGIGIGTDMWTAMGGAIESNHNRAGVSEL